MEVQIFSRAQNMEHVRNYYNALLTCALKTIPDSAVMIAGPVGIGTPHFEENVDTLRSYIREIRKKENVFDQTQFFDVFLPDAPHEYEQKFEIFYQGLIDSGKITKLYVLPGSESVRGVATEISYARTRGIPVIFL